MITDSARRTLHTVVLVITVLSACASATLGTMFYFSYRAHAQQMKDLSLKNFSALAQKINTMHHTRIAFISSLILLIACCAALITKAYLGNRRSLWILVASYSGAVALAIATMWHIELSYQTFKQHDNIIETPADVQEFIAKHKAAHPSIYQAEHHIVPSGLLTYAIEVKPNNDARIQTYAWSQFDNTLDTKIMTPFKLANRERIMTPNTYQQDNKTIMIWNSVATIPQSFDFKKYPFDKQEIEIDMYHPNYIQNVILTPDLASYDTQYKYPQLRGDLILDRWEVDDAYYYYRLSKTPTDFGIKGNQQTNNFPYLRLVVEVHRNIINPLISTLLPILIILFILFSVLLVVGTVETHTSLPSIVALLSGLFFATLVSDQTFDKTINAPTITYFKSFYYIAYVLIFLVSVNCFLYLFRHIRILQYDNNLCARLIFWPLVSTIFYGVTIYFFYNVG